GRPARAGVLDVDDRDAVDPDLPQHALTPDLLLPLQQAGERVRRVHGVHVLDAEPRVLEGGEDRRPREVLERLAREPPEGVHAGAGHRDGGHRTRSAIQRAISGTGVAGWKTA